MLKFDARAVHVQSVVDKMALGQVLLQVLQFLLPAPFHLYFHTNTSFNKMVQDSRVKTQHIGVYELTCPDCGKAYVGQTGWDFRNRFNEHKRSFIHNSQTSKYTMHLIEHSHTLRNMQDVMRVLQFQKKGLSCVLTLLSCTILLYPTQQGCRNLRLRILHSPTIDAT